MHHMHAHARARAHTHTHMFSIYKIAFEKEAPERMIQFLGENS